MYRTAATGHCFTDFRTPAPLCVVRTIPFHLIDESLARRRQVRVPCRLQRFRVPRFPLAALPDPCDGLGFLRSRVASARRSGRRRTVLQNRGSPLVAERKPPVTGAEVVATHGTCGGMGPPDER